MFTYNPLFKNAEERKWQKHHTTRKYGWQSPFMFHTGNYGLSIYSFKLSMRSPWSPLRFLWCIINRKALYMYMAIILWKKTRVCFKKKSIFEKIPQAIFYGFRVIITKYRWFCESLYWKIHWCVQKYLDSAELHWDHVSSMWKNCYTKPNTGAFEKKQRQNQWMLKALVNSYVRNR